MNCENCSATLTPATLEKPTAGPMEHEGVEVKIQCRGCGQGYYAYVYIEHFLIDPERQGKPMETEGA